MNNPYLYHPHPLCKVAADDIVLHIQQNPQWHAAFSQGKMLGVLITSRVPFKYICAYSGIVAIDDPEQFFVPPIYDLQQPDDFYKQGEAEISALNEEIRRREETLSRPDDTLTPTTLSKNEQKEIAELKRLRKEKSLALQLRIFSRFDLINRNGQYRNIVNIFSTAKRGLPPGGTGECAAPRLLQYAFQHGLEPIAMMEFWYGQSPKGELRIHRQAYPSCIEKCSPLLKYMLDEEEQPALLSSPVGDNLTIRYEDEYLLVIDKPADLLSTPAKDLSQPNVEDMLHQLYPEVKGPMLVHRLDQPTSGLLLAAKDAHTHKALQQMFNLPSSSANQPEASTQTIRKRYVALLLGNLPSECGIINLPLCTNPDDRPRQVVDRKFGKQAITRYRVLERRHFLTPGGKQMVCTMVAFYPITGRTHQLRLHAASPFGLDHPIVGDRLYLLPDHPLYEEMIQPSEPSASAPANELPPELPQGRLLLHAQRLTFRHPITGEEISLSSDPN